MTKLYWKNIQVQPESSWSFGVANWELDPDKWTVVNVNGPYRAENDTMYVTVWFKDKE